MHIHSIFINCRYKKSNFCFCQGIFNYCFYQGKNLFFCKFFSSKFFMDNLGCIGIFCNINFNKFPVLQFHKFNQSVIPAGFYSIEDRDSRAADQIPVFLAGQFDPKNYDPDRWLEAAARAGLALARLAVVPRAEDAEDLAAAAGRFAADFPEDGDRAVFLPGPRLAVSGTLIRARVAAGRSIRYLVPDTVAAAIREYALYQPTAARGVRTLRRPMATEPQYPETPPLPGAPTEVGEPLHAVEPALRRPGLPSRTSPPPASERAPLEVARRVVELVEDKKAADIVLLEIAPFTTVADYLVICSGGSERQLGAIADAVVEGLKHEALPIVGREGEPASHWVLIDAGAVIVHVFAPPEREFYALEKLWSDARTVIQVQ